MATGAPQAQAREVLSVRVYGIGLTLLAVTYLFVASWQYSPALFGAFHDDTLYFSTAKALSEGDGGVLPSLPGTPAQTKYPPLYPMLLSFVWQIQPEFPANLAWGWYLNLLLGIWALFAAGFLLCRFGCSRAESLGLAALFILNPYTILWSNLLLSDMLFAALVLTSILAADRAIEYGGRSFVVWWSVAVVFASLSVFTRTLGVAILGGLILYALSHKRFLAAVVATAGVLPVAWRLLSRLTSGTELVVRGGELNGFEQNWLYYTNYLEFWKLSVPSIEVLSAQVQFMLLELLKFPAVATLHFNAEGLASIVMQTTAIAISAGVIHGIVLRAKQRGMSAAHWMAVCYIPLILLWNYALMSRFWLAFIPLLLAGASHELGRLAGAIRKIFRESKQKDQRIAAALMGAALAGLVLNGTYRFAVSLPTAIRSLAENREKALVAKQEAYAWLANEAQSGATVVSYEDALAYLYSGSQGMRPFAASTAPFFLQDEDEMERDIARLGDTAKQLGARYWLVSDDDFELDYAKPQLIAATEDLLQGAPVVFESSKGTVRVYELDHAITTAAK